MATTNKKKVTTRKSVTTKKQKSPVYKSFKLTKESGKFVTFRLTKQTVYWAILLGYILFLDIWISNAQMSAMVLLL